MRSRWYHPPALHVPGESQDKRVTWLELFYDLIFVAAFIQLGNGLSNGFSGPKFLVFLLAMLALWMVWTGFTFYQNRFSIDDFAHRILTFLSMAAVGGMALGAMGVMRGEHVVFSTATGSALCLVAVMNLRAWRALPEARCYIGFWSTVFGLGGLIALAGAFLWSSAAMACWGLACGLLILAPLHPRSRTLADRFPTDYGHLSERYGLLTLIVLGAAFVKALGTLAGEAVDLHVYLDTGILLMITCGVWWLYFDDVAGARIREGALPRIVWLYAHLPVQIGVTACGVAVGNVGLFDWHAVAPAPFRWLLAGSLAAIYLGVAALDAVTERSHAELSNRSRSSVRWASALVILLLAPAGAAMQGGHFLCLIGAINLAQVVLDMLLAPYEPVEHRGPNHKHTSDRINQESARSGQPRKDTPRGGFGQTVRKGAPSELRNDLYYYFIEGSWLRVGLAFGFLFVMVNLFFAALYSLEPGSISNTSNESFIDAFFFSVQTISTIGYGQMSPANDFGNAIATFEAACGIILMAVVTGLVFAKVSRPNARVLFSSPLLLTRRNGQPALMFRVGNARGNEIVDATLDLTAILDEKTTEGHTMRRLQELKLLRARSPMFVLSQLVIHVIDDESPLQHIDWTQPLDPRLTFVATMTGHDGIYAQTVYARHLYRAEDVVIGARFVDVISRLPDGRNQIDYSVFDDYTHDDSFPAPPAEA